MSAWTARLTQLGITLPAATGTAPAGRTPGLVHTSTHLPLVGGVLPVTGVVGAGIGVPQAADLTRTAALNALAAVDAAAGLDAVTHVVRVVGYVAAGPDFTDHATVLAGATDLLTQLFGPAGSPACTVIGVTGLPLGAPVGVELLVAVHVPAAGDDRPAQATGERAGGSCPAAGHPAASVAGPSLGRAFELLHTGRWDEADRLLDRISTRSDRPSLAARGRYGQALLAAARGDTTRAWRLTDPMVSSGFRPLRLYGAHARALAALGRGDFAEAYTHTTAVTCPGELPADEPQVLALTLDLAEAAVRTGRQADAAAHAAAVIRAGTRSPRLILLTAGATALAEQNPELFEAALAVPDADRWPFDLARIRLCYGERLRRDGRTRHARAHLTAAHDTLRALGATPWAARAAAELRATAPTRSRCGSTDLTPQEREVAELAARGLTNKEIGERLYLSPRTVGAHLHHAFPKLGIATRAALRDALTTSVS